MNPSISEYAQSRLREIEAAGLLRKLRNWESRDARMIRLQDRDLLNFSSNDYLGLATDPRLRKSFTAAAQETVGATASRLITGNHQAYKILENEIACFKKLEAALVFTSGYAAAIGTIPVLVGENDFIVMDKLCHASLVDGARLSGAKLRIYPHLQLKRCAELLEICRKEAGSEGKILLITESVFSMDGDLAPLGDLVELKKKWGAWLFVDEAHGTGVFGKNGRGAAEVFGVEGEMDVAMGTLSKALGGVGGFICSSQALKELLVNKARSLIYSTGLPAAVCAAATTAIQLASGAKELREKLWKNVKLLSEQLKVSAQSPIVPYLIGDERRCMEIMEALRVVGMMVPGVRYPTVGKGKARLRISLNAKHTENDIKQLAATLLRISGSSS